MAATCRNRSAAATVAAAIACLTTATLLMVLLWLGAAEAHVALTYPPARRYDLDFLDNSRTKGPCGMPKGKCTTHRRLQYAIKSERLEIFSPICHGRPYSNKFVAQAPSVLSRRVCCSIDRRID